MGIDAEHHDEVPESLGEVAKVIIARRSGPVITRLSMMIERDRTFGEGAFRDLIMAAGLRVGAIRRMGFNREDGFDWGDNESNQEQHTLRRHAEILQEGGGDPA